MTRASPSASTSSRKSRRVSHATADPFALVKAVGLALPGVEATTRYDGAAVLKVRGCFMAGLATHPSAEPGTLVVRSGVEERGWLLDEAPDIYYLTDYYRPHPIVLVRLSRIDRDALRDLLSVSRRLTLAKAGRRGQSAGRPIRHRSTPRPLAQPLARASDVESRSTRSRRSPCP